MKMVKATEWLYSRY